MFFMAMSLHNLGGPHDAFKMPECGEEGANYTNKVNLKAPRNHRLVGLNMVRRCG